MAQFQQRELSDGGADAQLQVEQRIASNNRVAKTVSGGGRGMEMDGEQCEVAGRGTGSSRVLDCSQAILVSKNTKVV